jgi:hypothetical protein
VRCKTPVAADLLGQTYANLIAAVQRGRIRPPPRRDSSGHLWWGPKDLERARLALAVDRRKKENRAVGNTAP